MATYSDLPHQCNIEEYKADMKKLEDKCEEINGQIKQQYFRFYNALISLCNEKPFVNEDACCINGQSLVMDMAI